MYILECLYKIMALPAGMELYTEREMIQLRLRIKQFVDSGKKYEIKAQDRVAYLTSLVIRTAREKKLDPAIERGYYTCPPLLPYTTIESNYKRVLRITGMTLNDSTDTVAHANVISAHVLGNRVVTGGISVSNLIPVKSWSNRDVEILKSGQVADGLLFIDPLVSIQV
jgi:hypothetical protein